MKEKKIDILLSILSLVHLVFLGIAGSFAAEVMSDQPREWVLFTTSLVTIIFVILMTYLYSRLIAMTEMKNGK